MALVAVNGSNGLGGDAEMSNGLHGGPSNDLDLNQSMDSAVAHIDDEVSTAVTSHVTTLLFDPLRTMVSGRSTGAVRAFL